MPRLLTKLCHGVLPLLVVLASPAFGQQNEPPAEPETAAVKSALLFPSVSEIDLVLNALDIQIDTSKLDDFSVAERSWDELSEPQKKIQLGSLLGTLTIASQVEDLPKVVETLKAIRVGSLAIGIDPEATSQKSITEVIEKAEAGTISKAKLLALLDDLRREGLRDAAEVVGDTGLATILGASWLRGTSLLLGSTIDSTKPETLAVVFARPELITYISRAVTTDGSGLSKSQVEAATELEALAKKDDVTRDDLRRFSHLASQLLG